MMDFARSLAPLRDSDLTRAVPVLPSRFGGETPMSTTPVSQDETDPAVPTPMAERPRAVAPPSPAALVTPADDDSVRPHAVLGAPRSRQHEAATGRPRVIAADAEIAPALPPVSLRARVSAGRTEGAPSAASLQPVNADPAPVPQSPRAWSTARRDGGVAPQHVPRRPLSAPALAERQAPTTEPRPVVHVTIDRIDVRAPAASPRPAAAPRARNAAASVSLADYLRRGGGKSGGMR